MLRYNFKSESITGVVYILEMNLYMKLQDSVMLHAPLLAGC